MAEAVLHRWNFGSAEGLDATSTVAPPTISKAGHGPTGVQPHDFALVTDMPGFETLEGEWDALVAEIAGPCQGFQSFAWNWHWARNYLAPAGQRGGPRLAIVTGRRAGRLVLILPLVANRTSGLTQLSWMGEPVSQYADAIVAPEAADAGSINHALDYVVNAVGADVLNFRKIRADASIAPALALRRATVTASEEAPFMDFSTAPDFETFENNHGAKRKKNRRRQMRRMEERGVVSFDRVTGTEAAARLAARAIELKRASLEDRGEIALALADPRMAKFFADATLGLGHPTGTSVATISSNGEIAAMQISIDTPARRFLHVAVFDPKFDKCGAGSLLLEQATRDCYASGIAVFDLLCPKHEYKMDFASGTVVVSDYVQGLSLRGRAYVATALGFRPAIKRQIEALPRPVRRGITAILALANRR